MRAVEEEFGRQEDLQLVRWLRALADGTRWRMVREIAAAGELSCGQIGERFRLAQPTMSHHIKILADAGILRVRRDGQHGYLSLNRRLLDRLPLRLKTRLAGPAGGFARGGVRKNRTQARR